MAVQVKCIIIFQTNSGYGFTETHYAQLNQQPPVNLGAIIAVLDSTIAPLRLALLGGDVAIVGYRASYPQQGLIASQALTLPVARYGPAINGPSSSQNDSLATTMFDASNTRKKIIHLRGMPAAVVAADKYQPGALAGVNYAGAMSKYQAGLILNQFGWEGKNPTTSVFGAVTSYSQNAQDQVTFVCQTGPGSGLFSTIFSATNPQTYECRISKINYSHSVLNRTFVVIPTYSVGPPVVQTLTTVGPVATGPFLANGRFNVSLPVFVQYAVAGQIVLGERRMGKVLSHYPGRGKRRAEI
jgi:hypothetical protein